MTANEYQRQRADENGNVPFEEARVLYSLGIAGEAGEVADYMKKVIGHGKKLDHDELTAELGDVLWYLSMLAHIHGISLEEVMRANTVKLRLRYPHGFKGDLPHWKERTTLFFSVDEHDRYYGDSAGNVLDAEDDVILDAKETAKRLNDYERCRWILSRVIFDHMNGDSIQQQIENAIQFFNECPHKP